MNFIYTHPRPAGYRGLRLYKGRRKSGQGGVLLFLTFNAHGPSRRLRPKHKSPRHFRGRGLLVIRKGRSTCPYQSSRTTIRVLIGSFIAARRRASFAMTSLTPSISNMIRPGLTRQAQKSTEPLPLPIRTSVGFEVTGVSGKIRIQTRP